MQQPVQAVDTDFRQTSLQDTLTRCLRESPEEAVLALCRRVMDRVPAYGRFLSDQGGSGSPVTTWSDFQALPVMTKENYVRPYPLHERVWDARLAGCDMLATSSGSTGQPTYWPRALSHELAVASRFEQVFREGFQAHERTTLAVVCFALGTWVGGMYTMACCRHLAAKGYPITVVTPGNHPDDILRAVRDLGADFDQVVLLGYPPFLKDAVDTGIASGLNWSAYTIRCVMAGEVFSEAWRDLMAERVGSLQPMVDFASLYGTADAGVLGNETPISVCIRRFLADHLDAARALFGSSRLPTLVQYDPMHRFFEALDGQLVLTGDNGVPLIRYNILDQGGVVPYAQMLDFLAGYGFDPCAVLASQGLSPPFSLPFVYVFGRSNFVLSYFGANIYPETLSVGLEQSDVKAWVTGKFVMEVRADSDQNMHWCVAVELASGVTAEAHRIDRITQSIQTHVCRLNPEFAAYVPPPYQRPQVTLHPLGDPTTFPPGVKHRYTR